MSDVTPLTIDEETKFRESVAALRRVEDENGYHAMQWTNHAAERLLATLDSVRRAALSTTPTPDRLRAAVLQAGTRLTEQHGESCDCDICLIVQPLVDAALSATPTPLDAAWNAAEAALPKGWAISELRNQGTQWFARAEVWQPYATGQHERAVGPTPAAALLALAEKLREYAKP